MPFSPTKLNTGNDRPVNEYSVLNAQNILVERQQLNRILSDVNSRLGTLESASTSGGSEGTISITNIDGTISVLLANDAYVIGVANNGIGSAQLQDGSVTTSKISDEAVTFPKIQDITTDRLLGRDTTGSGEVEEISLNSTLLFTGSSSIGINLNNANSWTATQTFSSVDIDSGTAVFTGPNDTTIPLTVEKGTPATAPTWNATDVVVFASDSGGNTAINILAGNTRNSNINFADTDARSNGQISYRHSTDDFLFVAGGGTRISLSSALMSVSVPTTFTNNVTLGDDAGDTLTIAPNAVTWTNNPTHSGTHTWSGNQTISNALPTCNFVDTDGGTATVLGNNGALSLRSDEANVAANKFIDFRVGGAERGRITTTGINSTAIGATTRSTIACTTLDANGNVTLGDASTDTLTINGQATFSASSGTVTPVTFNTAAVSNSRILDVLNSSAAFRIGCEYDGSLIRLNVVDRSRVPFVTFVESGASKGLIVDGALAVNGNVTLGDNDTSDLHNAYGGMRWRIRHTHTVPGNRFWIESVNLGASAIGQTSGGMLLTAGGMNASTNKYGAGLWFGSTDTAFTTTNPKIIAGVIGYATETYDTDDKGASGLEFFALGASPGVTPTPVSLGTWTTTGLTLQNDLSVLGNTTLGDAAGDTLTINGTAVACNNGLNFDANTLVIDAANDRVLMGRSSSVEAQSTVSTRLQVLGTNLSGSSGLFARYSADTLGPAIYLAKSQNTTAGSHTIVNSGDNLGIINFSGSSGSAFVAAASIRAEVDGTPGATNDMPGRLLFYTTADGSGSVTERMRIDSSGGVNIGGAASAVASALLELTSTTRGFRPPRMTTTQRDAISSPAAGLVIYNTSTNKLNVYTTAWEAVTSA